MKHALLLSAVILPSLFIAVFGINAISKQRQSIELRLEDQITKLLNSKHDEFTSHLENALHKPLKEAQLTSGKLTDSRQSLPAIKNIVSENKIIEYPFVRGQKNQFIFPVSEIPTFITQAQPPKMSLPRINLRSFAQGRDLEFKQRNFKQAIRLYLSSIGPSIHPKDQIIIYYAISRCYRKLKKYPQALNYLREVINIDPQQQTDTLMLFSALLEAGQIYNILGNHTSAWLMHLSLYEKSLEFEASSGSNKFTYFKNTALHYLNTHSRRDKRFQTAISKDQLSQRTPLDISLSWRFYDFDTASTQPETSEENLERIQDLFLPTDEKTEFFQRIKMIRHWKKEGENQPLVKLMNLPNTGAKIYYTYENLTSKEDHIFGYKISVDQLNSILSRSALEDKKLSLKIISPQSSLSHALVSKPIGLGFQGLHLAIISSNKDYIQAQARQQILINYGLMGILLISLTMGIILYYKYLSREVELVKMKSSFLDSASHTLKTPLTRIRLVAEKIQLGWHSGKKSKESLMQTLLTETDRMGNMVNNMLDFSRIESGGKHYNLQKGKLEDLVSEHLEEVPIKKEIKGPLPEINFDPDAIRLILSNLIQNAEKYSAEEKQITLRLFYPKDWIQLEIQDRGIGIHPKEMRYIFDKFYRSPEVSNFEGSGIGLFLVKHAVAAHHGEISVESTPGKGTTFTIKFPILQGVSNGKNTDHRG